MFKNVYYLGMRINSFECIKWSSIGFFTNNNQYPEHEISNFLHNFKWEHRKKSNSERQIERCAFIWIIEILVYLLNKLFLLFVILYKKTQYIDFNVENEINRILSPGIVVFKLMLALMKGSDKN